MDVMSKVLRVSADELRMAADHLDLHATDLCAGHAAAHATMASAVTGFGSSSSAAALTQRVAQWEQETAEHCAELANHSNGHRTASALYATTDLESSARIASAGGVVDEAARAPE